MWNSEFEDAKELGNRKALCPFCASFDCDCEEQGISEENLIGVFEI